MAGLILSAYTADGGAGEALGIPTGGNHAAAGTYQQNFEGGIRSAAGATLAQGPAGLRVPPVFAAALAAVPAVPAAVFTAARLAIRGSYSWQMFIPLSAASGTAGAAGSGRLPGTAHFAVCTPGATRFLLGALSQPAALTNSLAFVVMLDTVHASGNPPVGRQAMRPLRNVALPSQTTSFTAAGVVHAAMFTGGSAPSGLITTFRQRTGIAGSPDLARCGRGGAGGGGRDLPAGQSAGWDSRKPGWESERPKQSARARKDFGDLCDRIGRECSGRCIFSCNGSGHSGVERVRAGSQFRGSGA